MIHKRRAKTNQSVTQHTLDGTKSVKFDTFPQKTKSLTFTVDGHPYSRIAEAAEELVLSTERKVK